LLSAIGSGDVAAVLSVEISRLARQDSEGHRLVEVAALMGVLLIDEQQVYDPNQPDDRLMLGLKVLLSSNEVRLMRQRLQEHKLHKARRGELRLELPIGLVEDDQGGIGMDPDEQVRAAVQLLFDRFRLDRQLSKVAQYFIHHGLLFPRRKGNWDGPLEWSPLSLQRIRYLLTNPLDAGAYVYARTGLRSGASAAGKITRRACRLQPADWGAVLWDSFPGYIGRAEYEANLECLTLNLQKANFSQRGRRKDGSALLSGIALCGQCGRRMYVHYSGKTGDHIIYVCNTDCVRYGKPICQRCPGRQADHLVVEHVMAALTPAQIELRLAALEELDRQQAELKKQWQLRLEGARYAAHLAQRRYEKIDPDNRLVARSLEAQWETCLQEVERLESEFGRISQQKSLALSSQQRQMLLALSQDLPKLWYAPTTSWAQRKDLLEVLIADVTLTRQDRQVCIQIRWHTNQVETCYYTISPPGKPLTSASVLQRIRELYHTHTDRQIADLLNDEGLKSATGKTFTKSRVASLRRKHGIPKLAPQLSE